MKEGLKILFEDTEVKYPACQHGPVLLFENAKNERFFACSAAREKTDCPIQVNYEDFIIGNYSKTQIKQSRKQNETLSIDEIRKTSVEERFYCFSCNVLSSKRFKGKHQNHKVYTGAITDAILDQPTQILPAMDNDKIQAQYFFSPSTLTCFEGVMKRLNLKKFICIGAPRLHEFILNNLECQSILLDIDDRFSVFHKNGKFLRYNMFNHFFFYEDDKIWFKTFLRDGNKNETICIVIDPPFGCRTECLAFTLNKIKQEYNTLNSKNSVIPIFLILPYFMEHYVKKEMPAMEMTDFQVDYTNHKNYRENHGKGSAARIFTNVPLNLVKLPTKNEEYRFCNICQKFVHRKNVHCKFCKECPSKNGSTYVHCGLCNICVKPNYKHCKKCGRCVDLKIHNCKEYMKHITCKICRMKGHSEILCTYLPKRKLTKKKNICLICQGSHSVGKCPKRELILGEIYFMGSYKNRIKDFDDQ